MPQRPPIIDADGHILERESDIHAYLPEPWNRRASRLLPEDYPWDDSLFGTLGAANPAYEPVANVRYTNGMSPEAQIEAWHQIMDREGIAHAVCFPTRIGRLTKLHEREFQVAVARACNDHFARDYNARSGRVHCVGILPLGFPEDAAQELRRGVTELGLVSFALHTLGLPRPLGDPCYAPVYAAAEELGVPLCIHGTRAFPEEVGADRLATFNEVHTYAFPAGMMLQFTSMLCQGIPIQFPRLRLAFLEIGATWLPYYLDRLDEHWEKRRAETPLLTRKPSAVTREANLYFSIEAGETLLPETVQYLGAQHFLYASDIPHWDNEFPHSLEALWAHPSLSQETREKILYQNPQVLFGLSEYAAAPA
jgi:predicted TIM-barrel fold metal-dependent hydrolase